MRFFNTTGPVRPDDHYHVPPLDRLALDDVRTLIQQKKYFVLHAPRQTGKTSSLLALRDMLNAEGDYRCVYVNVEAAQALREDVEQATQVILGELASRARLTLGDEFSNPDVGRHFCRVWTGGLARGVDALGRGQPRAAGAADRRNRLIGDSLLAVLRQLRAGYDLRPEGFPQSVVLCGVRGCAITGFNRPPRMR